jgi:exonuclease III
VDPPPQQGQKKKIKKNTRASIHIASLNMRGRGSGQNDKWNNINQVMKEHRIAVLAIQEAHLTQQHVDNLHGLFGKRLQIHFSQGANTNAQGVAIILNRELTNVRGIQQWEIIPGRAILLTLPWHSDLKLTILNVYAPNPHNENQIFWEKLNSIWEEHEFPHPDIILGDFNLVEDSLDRLPSHSDPPGTVEMLETFRARFQLVDGWRTTNPDEKSFSFLQQSTAVQSRIDRIYMKNKILKTASGWKMEWTALNTDHKMVSVHITDHKVPFIGRGRWTLPLFLLKDKTLIQEIQSLGRVLEETLEGNLDRSNVNPQRLFNSFKEGIFNCARARAKIIALKTNYKVKCLRKEVNILLNSSDIEPETLEQST